MMELEEAAIKLSKLGFHTSVVSRLSFDEGKLAYANRSLYGHYHMDEADIDKIRELIATIATELDRKVHKSFDSAGDIVLTIEGFSGSVGIWFRPNITKAQKLDILNDLFDCEVIAEEEVYPAKETVEVRFACKKKTS